MYIMRLVTFAALALLFLMCMPTHAQEVIFSDSFEDGICAGPFNQQLYLWEVDSDQEGLDVTEFIELFNLSGAVINLEPYFVLLVNGADDLIYDSYQFQAGATLPIEQHFVLGNWPFAGQDFLVESDVIQNGADGVLLVRCDTCASASASFPIGWDPGVESTFITADDEIATKIDGLAYDTNDPDDVTLMVKLGVAQQFNEDADGAKDFDSNNRFSHDSWLTKPSSPSVSTWPLCD